MFGFIRFEPAERIAQPNRSLRYAGCKRFDTPLDQFAQRFFDPVRKLLERSIFVIGGEEHAAIGKVPPPELIERLELGRADR